MTESTIYKNDNLRVWSVSLAVDSREISALFDSQVQAAGVKAVDHRELHLAPDRHRAVPTAFLRVDAQHRFGTRLKKITIQSNIHKAKVFLISYYHFEVRFFTLQSKTLISKNRFYESSLLLGYFIVKQLKILKNCCC